MIDSSAAYRAAVTADARRMCVKAVIDIEDPDIVRGEQTGSEQEPGISRPEQLWDKEFELTANYGSMEPNRWILDGSYINRPADSAERDWEAGRVGALISGPDGAFSRPQIVNFPFSNVGVLQACSVAFSDAPEDGAAADFTVEIVSEGVVYYTKTVTGNTNSLYPVIGFRVNNPDCIRLTVTRWSLPGRRMRIAEIVPGVYEVWTGDEMAEFSVKHQGDPSCLTLPYATASITFDNQNRRFDPRTKDGIFLMLEERQGIDLYMGPMLSNGRPDYKPLGVFYQSGDGWKTGDNSVTMAWNLVDIIGLISQRTYTQKGDEAPATLKGWLEALAGQLGENFTHRVRVDPEYADLPVTADQENIKGMSCGDILRFVCMATGTWPRADQTTGYLTAEPMWNQGNKITLDNLNSYPTISANQDTASVSVSWYPDGASEPSVYAADGNSASSGNTVETSNPFIHGQAEAAKAAKNILSFYGGNKIELTGRGDPSSEIGDVDTIWLAEGNAASARRIKQELNISDGVLRNCKSSFIRGDGLFTFTDQAKITENGVFVVPPDVYSLRVTLVGRGQDGGNGRNGARGIDGPGGKVWNGIIAVNPGQKFQAAFGQETTFGPYSSANGQVYPDGFTDISTGSVYARTGVSSPQPGTGDGGEGGTPGRKGGVVWAHATIISAELWYITVTTLPAIPGGPGVPGASGCALIYWEKPEAEA